MKKELLQRNKNIFKALHEIYNFDFESDFTIQKYTGKFTVNTISKSLGNIDIDETNTVVVLADVKYRENYCYIVRVTKSGFCISFPKKCYFYGLDDFYSKGRFEDFRKEENKTYYIISQSKEFEKAASKKEVDYNSRFKYVSKIGWGDGKGNHGISQIDLLDTSHNGGKFTIHTQHPASSTDVNYFVDKSGYIVEGKKEELKRKARALKREREKANVDSVNFDKELKEIKKTLEHYKNKYMGLFANCNNYDSICQFESKLLDFRWVLLSVERFEKNNTNKNFSSISEAENRLNTIYAEIEKVKELF